MSCVSKREHTLGNDALICCAAFPQELERTHISNTFAFAPWPSGKCFPYYFFQPCTVLEMSSNAIAIFYLYEGAFRCSTSLFNIKTQVEKFLWRGFQAEATAETIALCPSILLETQGVRALAKTWKYEVSQFYKSLLA